MRVSKLSFGSKFILFFCCILLILWKNISNNNIQVNSLKKTYITKPIVNFLHIPKCAGVSFYTEMKEEVKFTDYSPGNNEVCFAYMKKTKGENFPYVTFIRNPLKHILSQYIMCRYSSWGKLETGNKFWKSFRVDNFDNNDYSGFEDWLRYFETTTNSHGCYYPYNLQTRVLTCEKHKGHYYIDNFYYSSEKAFDVLKNLNGVFGIVEYYPESLCLIKHSLGLEFPIWCECKYRNLYKMTHYTHDLPKHSVKTVDSQIMDKAMKFIRHDVELYYKSLELFFNRINELEKLKNINILCK